MTGFKVNNGNYTNKDLSEIFKAGTSSIVTNYKTSILTDIGGQFQPINVPIPRPFNKQTGYKIANGTDLCDLFAMDGDAIYETNCIPAKINGNTLTFDRIDYLNGASPYIKFLQPATINVTLIGGGGGGNMGYGTVTIMDLLSGCSGGGGGGGGTIIASNLEVGQNEQFDITIGYGAETSFVKGSGIDGGESRFYSLITDLRAFGGLGGGTSTSPNLTLLKQMCKGGTGGSSFFSNNVVNVTPYAGGNGGEGTYWGDPKYDNITDKTEYYKTNFGNGKYTVNGTSGGGGGGWNTAVGNDPSTISYWVGQGGQEASGGAALYSKQLFNDTKGIGYGRGGGGLYNDASLDSGGASSIESGADGVVIVEII